MRLGGARPFGDEPVRQSGHRSSRVREAGTDPSIPSSTTVPSSWTIDAGRAFIDRQRNRIESGEGISLAIHAFNPDRTVGLVSMMLRRQPGVIGLGYWVVPSARQRGFARRAAILAGDWAVGSGGFARIEAWVEPDNQPSQSVLTAAGFELEGRRYPDPQRRQRAFEGRQGDRPEEQAVQIGQETV